MWELEYKESWAAKNWCFSTVVLEKALESPLDCKEIKPVHPKINQSWIFMWKNWCWSSNTLATWREEVTHRKRPWCWARLKAGGEGDDRRWDGWMASLSQWAWAWASSGSWWWTGKPGVLQSTGSQRIGHDWAIELNKTVSHSRTGILLFQLPKVHLASCWQTRHSRHWINICTMLYCGQYQTWSLTPWH